MSFDEGQEEQVIEIEMATSDVDIIKRFVSELSKIIEEYFKIK